MAKPGTFERLLAEVGQALLPLRDALASPSSFYSFTLQLGWAPDDVPQPLRVLGTSVDTLYESLRRMLGDGGLNIGGSIGADGSATVNVSVDDIARTLTAVQGVIEGVRGIASAPDSAFPESLRADGFPRLFPRQLIDFLVVTYLRRYHPTIGFMLRALGVVRYTYSPATGARPAYMHCSLHLEALPQVLSNPSLVLENAFGWGTPNFDFAEFARHIEGLMLALGVDVLVEAVPMTTALGLTGAPSLPKAPRATKVVIFERLHPTGDFSAVVRLIELPAVGGTKPGLALLPAFDGKTALKMQLGPDLAMTISSDLDLQGGVGLKVRPGEGVAIVVGFADGGAPTTAKGAIEVRVERSDATGEPTVLLGAPDRTRLQYRKIGGAGGVRLSGDAVDVYAEVELLGLEFVFEPSEADGFIADIIPRGGFTFGTNLTLGISHSRGLYFRGTSNLELQLPAHVQLGPVEIQSLTISASPSGEAVPIGLGVTFKAELGPIRAVVERIGLTARLAVKPEHDGNLGPVDLSIGFMPPKGVGLSVAAGVVSGGGYLYFDPDKGEYAGALELEFANFLELKAIALISTRMPDGSAGFSLLIVITTEFGGGGIQLGYGFTLLAVGGVLGLNRRMDLQALVEGVRTGRIESVMFPQDVVANAPRILSDLRAFFPPEQGKFLIGPMAKIGWGTPALVTVSLGVIIEIPGNIAILGVLKCVLPTQQLSLLVLQVDFIGAIEFDKSRLWFFAQLFDSRILTMTIDGGMGLLIGWGDNADLVLTVGGFHPSFKPPPLPFPVPNRLTVDIINQPGRLIRVSGYFAITSNTVQFGARAELRLGFDDFGIEGHLAFDALFRFSPFAFVIAISAGVTLKAFGIGLLGIDLRLQLEGPAPWRARGRGSISLLFFEISADFDITWGEEQNTTLPPIEVLPLLANEISKLSGWQTRLPTGGNKALVTLRTLPETDQLVLHPLGTLFIRQRAIPLDVRLDRVGAQRPSDGKQFSVAPVPDSGLVRASVTGDKFAMAQFQDMDDAAKLSRPAYEVQDAGLELTAAAGTLASARAVRRSTRYELHIVDSKTGQARGAARTAGQVRQLDAATPRPKRTHDVNPAVFNQLLQGSSTSRSPLSQREAQLRQPVAASDTVQVTVQRYVVAYFRNNLQAFPPSGGGTVADFRSQTAALDALAAWVDADPSLAGALHVIPESEVVGPLATPATWSVAPAAPFAAAGAGAVRLGSGKVFVTGGADSAGKAVAAAALFDPIANTWTAAQAPPAGRRLHSVTKLPDGRVLVAGGIGTDGTAMSAAEIYDPVAGSWSPAGNLGTARSGHSAILLATKMVLIAGGTAGRGAQGDGALSSAELFDPATGKWSAAAAMTDARSGHQVVSLRDDRVLVIGGALATGGREAPLAYCERYDPVAGTWTPAGSLNTPRVGHQATALADGTVLVVGGDPTGIPTAGMIRPSSLDSAERYDPTGDVWTRVKGMPGGRGRHRSVLLRSGMVLVIGGTGGPAFAAGYRNVTTYEPATGTWTTTGGMATGRSDFAAIALADGRVLITGGLVLSGAAAPGPDPGVATATTEIFTP